MVIEDNEELELWLCSGSDELRIEELDDSCINSEEELRASGSELEIVFSIEEEEMVETSELEIKSELDNEMSKLELELSIPITPSSTSTVLPPQRTITNRAQQRLVQKNIRLLSFTTFRKVPYFPQEKTDSHINM